MDICPCNICPGNICPYQQYPSFYWPDYDQILKVGPWDHHKHIQNVTVKFIKNFNNKILLKKNVHLKKISTKEKCSKKNISSNRNCVSDVPRNLPLKFCQNHVSNCGDIPDLYKCRKDKYCMDKCHCDNWNMFKMVPGTYL